MLSPLELRLLVRHRHTFSLLVSPIPSLLSLLMRKSEGLSLLWIIESPGHVSKDLTDQARDHLTQQMKYVSFH